MNWLDKYKPKYLKDFKTNKDEIKKAINWIENYKKDFINTKKVLLIIGLTGTGKTLLADLIFKEYNYQKIELNSTDIRSQKKISEFLKKSLTYKNVVDMFNEGNSPIGVLLDEIDTICKLSDKGGFSEFLSILKMNDKYEIHKKNIDLKKKTKKKNILADEYIKLYNPIICTSNDTNDKKITELKKYAEVIFFEKPNLKDLLLIIDEIFLDNNQEIECETKLELINYSQFDIRRLIIILENIYYLAEGKIINSDIFNKFKLTYKEKEENIQLIESTKRLISHKITFNECDILFDVDCLLTPLMIYHNSINYIKNTEDNLKKKLDIYKNVLKSLCIHDTIQTNIFELQDWDQLYDIASIYGSFIPNYYFNKLKNKKEINIEFTSLLNKISQMYVNKKLLNSAKYSIGKINYDNDEIIYLTEIVSHYFDNYKDNINDKDDKDNENNEEDSLSENLNENLNMIQLKNVNNSELINFMNKYYIGIEGLENILKIEKLNKINEKRKKKFTLKIKKDISQYLLSKN